MRNYFDDDVDDEVFGKDTPGPRTPVQQWVGSVSEAQWALVESLYRLIDLSQSLDEPRLKDAVRCLVGAEGRFLSLLDGLLSRPQSST
ncbi:MAG TPA: hypothetical protein VIA06_24385 [Candidatus Dormibacteraeota bacterium]|jgi:hypothetical protein|nr:hypothetical protein [Candidatus Dormibacteraeota bacterium]